MFLFWGFGERIESGVHEEYQINIDRFVIAVLNLYGEVFYGVFGMHRDGQRVVNRFAPAFIFGEASSVSYPVFGRGGQGRRSERPGLVAVFLPDKENLGWRIGDGVVAPGRETAVLAVLKPGSTEGVFGRHGTEIGIGEKICPGLRREIFRTDAHSVFIRIRIKATEFVPEEERFRVEGKVC